ncbi:type III PLP-dependent enzyme domain-containing protein [Mycolicibacterium neworleansense]|uniref:Diaminopimelate decarboxylase n=1 Tax=Mycolicibacterium neworleansense TaxID=146018 RepID=A0A0H5RV62_9MYCO|nr:diaminopimelate decarboxylase [Mycolicibacterium neworleansense]MCV7360590.1 diaminopimelate decarboxylase [Mycolicibacterium neworleansense]CRZ17793.1 diaminopimelate decarboxylase [Mycolicibacterium neworleansense]
MIDAPLRTGQSLPGPDTLLDRRGEIVAGAVRQGFIDDLHPLCGVVDLDTLDELMRSLTEAYPPSMPALHTIAAKAITLRPVLARFAQAGFGCEVASPGELELALAAGFSAERIVFDSPAKTTTEIERALALGVSFNIDNFEELARVDQAIARVGRHRAVIGMRLNPQTGAGAIGAMSTATATSKFGIGLADHRDDIIDAFAVRPWLTQLHVHSGSQGLSLEHAAEGVRLIDELARQITARVGHQQVRRIDIGGGLPVNFGSDDITPSFADHRAVLEGVAPELFDGTYGLVTEFGRALTAKAGTIVARVEYTKVTGGRPIAITHAGVQVATRTIFGSAEWPLRIEVYDGQGRRRVEQPQVQDVAGPACFTGDMLAVGRDLPFVRAGDLVAVPDTGGYYFSTHFSYNALPRPAVYTVGTDSEGDRRWSLARRAQTTEEIVAEAGEPSLVPLPLFPSA